MNQELERKLGSNSNAIRPKVTWLTLIQSLDSQFIFLIEMDLPMYLLAVRFIMMTKRGQTKNATEALGNCAVDYILQGNRIKRQKKICTAFF